MDEARGASSDGSSPRRPRKALLVWIAVVVVLLGAIPAFTGLWHPPQALNPDEAHFVPAAFRAGNSSTLDPGYYKNPGGPVYAYLAWIGLDFLTGLASGEYAGTADLARAYLVEPTGFYHWCRVLAALSGLAAAALLAVGLARRFDPLTGVFAGACMASSLLLQSKMHAAIDESMLVLVCSAALLVFLRLRKSPSWRTFLAASVLTGLAAGTKWNGAVLGIPWALAAWRTQRAGAISWKGVAAGAAAGLVTLILTTPHLLLSFEKIVEQNLHSLDRLGDSGPYWEHAWGYLRGYAVDFLVPWAAIPALIGWGLGDTRRRPLARLLLVEGGLIAALLLLFLARGQLFATRYALPVLPWVVAAASVGLAQLCRVVSSRPRVPESLRAAPAVLALGLLFAPAWCGTFAEARMWSGLDARARLTERIRALCRPGDRIVTDWYGPLLPQTEYLELHAPGADGLRGVVHLRAHALFDYLDRGLNPLPGLGGPPGLGEFRERGYRYLVMRERTFALVGPGTRAHAELVAFVAELSELEEPEVVHHATGRAVYRIYSLD